MALRHAYATRNTLTVGTSCTWSDGTTTNRSYLCDGHMDRQFVTGSNLNGVSVVVDLLGASTISAVAVLNSSVAGIGGTVTLKVEYADDAAFTTNVATAKAATTLNITSPKHKDHVLQFAATSKRYWRLTWTWTGTTTLSIGELYFANTTALSRAIVYGNTTGYEFVRTSIKSSTGETRSHYIAGPVRVRALPFEDLSASEVDELRAMHAATYGGASSMLWCESYEATATAAANAEQDCIFGTLEEETFSHTEFDYLRFTPSGLTLRSRGREVGA